MPLLSWSSHDFLFPTASLYFSFANTSNLVILILKTLQFWQSLEVCTDQLQVPSSCLWDEPGLVCFIFYLPPHFYPFHSYLYQLLKGLRISLASTGSSDQLILLPRILLWLMPTPSSCLCSNRTSSEKASLDRRQGWFFLIYVYMVLVATLQTTPNLLA